MPKKKQRTAQIFALFALLGIILSVVGTGLLVLTSGSQDSGYSAQEGEGNQEQLQQIIEAVQPGSGGNTPTVTVDGVEVKTEIVDNTTKEGEIKQEEPAALSEAPDSTDGQ